LHENFLETKLETIKMKKIGLGLTLSLTGGGPIDPSLTYMQIPLKELKVRYRQKLGIPQAGSWACFEITLAPTLSLISLLLSFL
jgi:hypothetical protein